MEYKKVDKQEMCFNSTCYVNFITTLCLVSLSRRAALRCRLYCILIARRTVALPKLHVCHLSFHLAWTVLWKSKTQMLHILPKNIFYQNKIETAQCEVTILCLFDYINWLLNMYIVTLNLKKIKKVVHVVPLLIYSGA